MRHPRSCPRHGRRAPRRGPDLPASSPVLAVGSQVIDATPTPVKEWAVGTFGTADKPILIGSVAVVSLLLAALAGTVRPRSRLASTLLLLLLTGLAGAAAVLRPTADDLAWLPALVAAVVGILTLDLLVARVLPSGSAHADPTHPTRRRVVALGGTGAAALAIGGSGQALVARSAPPTLTLPRPTRPLPALPKGVDVGKSGISPSSRRMPTSTGSTPHSSPRASTPASGR